MLSNYIISKIKEALIKDGFDGLCSEDCGCFIDDLVPCSDCFCHCEPGYKHGDKIYVYKPNNICPKCHQKLVKRRYIHDYQDYNLLECSHCDIKFYDMEMK